MGIRVKDFDPNACIEFVLVKVRVRVRVRVRVGVRVRG
jgi:hypothetical protein